MRCDKYYAGVTAIADSSRNFNLSILATNFSQQNSKEIEWFCKKNIVKSSWQIHVAGVWDPFTKGAAEEPKSTTPLSTCRTGFHNVRTSTNC